MLLKLILSGKHLCKLIKDRYIFNIIIIELEIYTQNSPNPDPFLIDLNKESSYKSIIYSKSQFKLPEVVENIGYLVNTDAFQLCLVDFIFKCGK